MIKGKVTVKISSDQTKALNMVLKELDKASVYVGIPEENADRKDGGVNNAQLLMIHTKGSPVRGIPARPVLEPAIEADDNRLKISAGLLNAARQSFNGNKNGFITMLNNVGRLAQGICQRWFTDPRNGWPPNQAATVLAKIRKIKGKRGEKAAEEYKRRLAAGESMVGLDTPLIDTGEMRQAITYIVKENK